ncbi:MaoC family dehydratase [Actinocatenispora comari]|jgi:acyl dehydratase|uniref:MaoC family dehydratase n=1 Tax=Actinocatenispora comari TaxID=2807577 RepID=A0A8J4EJV2_9ACTN|nr:MaoC family dehydratase [Actinocatenispora comari]GIL26721.1 MaoC family dehydratase [Actinocatenispora comari]
MIAFDEAPVGTELPTRTFRVTRTDLVRYAGASGDFNVIHWNERRAISVGLPDVIAHGMYTMGLAGRAVTDWLGDPGALVDFGVRFSRPVVVPDTDDGTEVQVGGVVKRALDDRQVVIELTVTSDGVKVLGQARATVRLS